MSGYVVHQNGKKTQKEIDFEQALKMEQLREANNLLKAARYGNVATRSEAVTIASKLTDEELEVIGRRTMLTFYEEIALANSRENQARQNPNTPTDSCLSAMATQVAQEWSRHLDALAAPKPVGDHEPMGALERANDILVDKINQSPALVPIAINCILRHAEAASKHNPDGLLFYDHFKKRDPYFDPRNYPYFDPDSNATRAAIIVDRAIEHIGMLPSEQSGFLYAQFAEMHKRMKSSSPEPALVRLVSQRPRQNQPMRKEHKIA